jgi:hypothetical protein
VNHLLSARRSQAEATVTGFECYAQALAAVPLEELAADAAVGPEEAALAQEVKVGCTIGMLLCLAREQRLVFILGEVLELPDTIGAEVLALTRDGFRQQLARARQQLRAFLAAQCGLVDPRNPCRCARKTRGFIRAGLVDPGSLRFASGHRTAVERGAPRRARELDAWLAASIETIHRGDALRARRDVVAAVTEVVRSADAERLLAPPGRLPS